jgi:hypothetical protein
MDMEWIDFGSRSRQDPRKRFASFEARRGRIGIGIGIGIGIAPRRSELKTAALRCAACLCLPEPVGKRDAVPLGDVSSTGQGNSRAREGREPSAAMALLVCTHITGTVRSNARELDDAARRHDMRRPSQTS